MAYTNIKKSSDYFNTKLYSGTDSAQSVTGVGFQPDWTWIKCRSHGGSGSFNHVLTDVIRGAGEVLVSNSNSASNSSYDYGSLASLDSDGFTTAAGGTSIDGVGGAGRTYASWNWKANGTGVANTDGSINSTVSVNTTSGFSIVSYTGTGSNATVGHGLGAVPTMIIAKETIGSANDWTVYHVAQGSTTRGILNETNTWGSNTAWNNTTPTSSFFYIGSGSNTNRSGSTYIAYCFADVQGFSKIGSYTGNGSTDGTFVYTGFKPAFVIIKNTGASVNWLLKDNKRPSYQNVNDTNIYPNLSNAEETPDNNPTDFLSNGFKARNTGSYQNASGSTYIYMAFAEQPLVGDNPATAR